MCNAALNIVAGFRELHNKGYSYQDLNDGNFFIHPKSGDVLICDNDNVSEFGKSSGIAGKARYMAPEIVVKGVPPNTQTDRFSLSVILFLLWTNNHPLEGRAACPPCMDAKNERRIYGEKPLFIFDPQDVSNRPVPGLHKGVIARYPFLPKYLQDEFVKAFSHQAMHTPSRRIIEREWLHLFLRMRGEVYKCAGCGEVYFADPVHPSKCPKCQRTASLWGYLKTPRYNLGIHRKTRLYACHAHKDNDDHETQIGQVIAGAGGFALQNQTRKEWRVVSEGKTAVLKPSEAVALKKQMKIGLGDSDIEIV
jgi:DNA-binding helix-hairpin-helix protein with protein kinase domain